jgi:peptide/nickel transport system permease protein
MWRFILSRTGYGLLVLWGVVTVVFLLFNLSPGDPARNLAGENAPAEVVDNIRRKLNLDLSKWERYVLYLNDLSPVSCYTDGLEGSRRNWRQEEHGGVVLFRFSSQVAVLKGPYLNRSFLSDRSVSSILGEAMPGTAVLAVLAILSALLAGLSLGVLAALHKDTGYDRLILFLSALGMAGPSFFVAILVAWIGAVLWREEIVVLLWPFVLAALAEAWRYLRRRRGLPQRRIWTWAAFGFGWILALWVLPDAAVNPVLRLPGTGLNMTGSLYSVSAYDGAYLDLRNLILPVITLAIRPLAVIVQLTRSSVLETLAQDYVRTARAKGLSETRVVIVHALRNALNPVITAVSGWFASLLAGAVFVEFVFGWKGLGQELFLAIEKQDLPVVMGGVILIAVIFVMINILVDIAYGWVDPRVRKSWS